jgi:hypothetical protein
MIMQNKTKNYQTIHPYYPGLGFTESHLPIHSPTIGDSVILEHEFNRFHKMDIDFQKGITTPHLPYTLHGVGYQKYDKTQAN